LNSRMKFKDAIANSNYIRHPNLYRGHWLHVVGEAEMLRDAITEDIYFYPNSNHEGWEVFKFTDHFKHEEDGVLWTELLIVLMLGIAWAFMLWLERK
jgi:hypothetical protein